VAFLQPGRGKLPDPRLHLRCTQEHGELAGKRGQAGIGEAAHRGKYEINSRTGSTCLTSSAAENIGTYPDAEQVIDVLIFSGQFDEMICPACLTSPQYLVDLAHISWMKVPRKLDQPFVS